jgi:hypothetical protein
MSNDGVEVGAANNKVNHGPDHNRREVARGHAVIAKGSFGSRDFDPSSCEKT